MRGEQGHAGSSRLKLTGGCSMRRLLLRHGIETGFRQAELSTLTGEFDPPHIDRVPKTQSEIHCSGMSATEEYSIHGPEH
jgi:hypothetical protein